MCVLSRTSHVTYYCFNICIPVSGACVIFVFGCITYNVFGGMLKLAQ